MVRPLADVGENLDRYLIEFKGNNPHSTVSVSQPNSIIGKKNQELKVWQQRLFIDPNFLENKPSPRKFFSKRYLQNEEIAQIRTMFYQSTGLDINFQGSAANQYCLHLRYHRDIESLVDYDDPARSLQVKINQKLNDFVENAMRVRDNEIAQNKFAFHNKGARSIVLYRELRKLSNGFFNNYNESKTDDSIDIKQEYENFKTELTNKIQAADFLDEHSSHLRLILHMLLTTIKGLGLVTGLADYGYKLYSGHYLFSDKTHSRKLAEESIETVCNLTPLFPVN